MTIKVGSVVEIVNRGGVYSTYDKWAERHGMKNWAANSRLENGDLATVVAVGEHTPGQVTTPLVGVERNGRSYIMSKSAVQEVGSTFDLTKPVFTEEGTPVTVVSLTGRDAKFPVLVYEGNATELTKYSLEGKAKNGVERRNLTNKAAPAEDYYVNLYDPDDDGVELGYKLHKTLNDAVSAGNNTKMNECKPVGVAKIVIVKGRAPIRNAKRVENYEPPVVGYVNVYDDNTTSATLYKTRKDANEAAGIPRIACVRIEFTPGQYDN